LEEGTYNVVFGWRDDSGAGDNPPAAIDNFSFSLMACPAPSDLAEDAEQTTTQTIGLTWTEKGSASAWKIRYKKSSEADWTVVADPIAETEYVLSGLDAATTYQIQVAAWCDPEDAEGISAFSESITVSTLCDVVAAFPWSENFDNVSSSLPICWNSINNCTSATYAAYPKVYNSSSYAYSGTKSLFFESDAASYYDPQDQYAVLPEMEGINGLRIKLFARAYSLTEYDDDWGYIYYDATFSIGVMSDPEDEATFEEIATFEPQTTSYEPFEVRFNTYTGAGKYIAIKMAAAADVDYRSLLIDDIEISEIPSCDEATGLKVVEVGADTATLAWDALENGAWQFAIVEAGVVPTEDDFASITDTFKIVEGLASSTAYTFYLRRDCQSSVSPAISVSFQTLQTPVAVPFADDFEDGNKWFFINGNLSNAWAYGAAATESGHAIYVSNDGGTTNAYTNNVAVMVYAVKLFSFAQGTYTFQYDWKANGESSYDYLRVALVPADVELAASTSAPSGFGTSTLPTGWIALDGGSKLNQSADWTTFTTAEMAIPAGEYRVVFGWRDDTGVGDNPPAAIDNFSISKVACAKQTALTIDAITATTATLSWTAGDEEQNAWEIAIDTIAGFDPDTLSVLLDAASNPYIFQNLEPETRYYVYVRANCGDEVHSAWSAVANFKTTSACETPSNLEASDITSATAIIRWNTYGLEEFNLRYSEDGTNWITVNAVAMPYSIEDLAPNTSYRVQVQATCNTEVWSTAKTFKTACEAMTTMPLENFDALTVPSSTHVMPDCWSYINTSSYSYYNYYPTVYNSSYSSYSGANYLRFYSYYSSYSDYDPQDQYAILPAMTNVSGLRMRLQARKYESYYDATVIAGVMSDPTDTATFVAIDTISPTSTSYSEFVVMFNTYEGEGQYIALKMLAANAQSSSRSIYLDDVEVELIPNCLEPTALAASNVTARTAVLDWTSDVAAWQICLNDDEDNLIDVDAKPFVLEGLTPETAYSVKVRAICADEEESAWSNSISFATLVACPAPTALKAILTPGNGSIATLKWSAGAAEEAWVIEYDTDADFATAIDSAVVDSTIDLTGLVAEQTYYARVKANCGEEDGESVWSAVISFVPTDALELIVNDGTTTGSYLPFYGLYCDEQNQHGQFIIPAEDLAGINGDSITQLTFFSSSANVSWGNASFKVYMGEVENTTLSDFYADELTLVMDESSLSVSSGEMEVVLDAPYKYQGGNLLIDFTEITTGSYTSLSWYGVSADAGAGYSSYGNSLSVGQRNFLPKMKINYAKSSDVPGPGEGIFQTGADGKAVKFIRNNHVYILINGTVYNVTGQKVEVK